MNRYLIVVGDAPACGGAVLPYEGDPPSTILGHRIALVGGRVQCEGCRSVGVIAKAGGPYRMQHCGVEQALEGDVVLCRCPVPPPLLIASLQRMCSCDDRSGIGGEFVATAVRGDWHPRHLSPSTSSKKNVQIPEITQSSADASKTFCPGVSDEKFFEHLMKLRTVADGLVNRKIADLETWHVVAQQDFTRWFGQANNETREYIHAGLRRMTQALNGLTEKNFVRFPHDFSGRTECALDDAPMVVAAVCKTDVKNRIIGISRGFCALDDVGITKPSKAGTLVHEVAHFDDIFSSDDHAYGHTLSRLKYGRNRDMAIKNTDSIVGYLFEYVVYDK